MRRKLLPLIVLILTMVCMVSTMSVVVFAEPNSADNTPTDSAKPLSDIKIMHITDIHYIPSYYCYLGDLKENSFATKIKGDPKLMLESYAILEETIDMIRNEKNVPDYVFLTGDITSNGEKQSLIDVANALRALQNELRKKNPNFQILVVPGNHDVFNNRHASFYNLPDGKKRPATFATRREFVKIFSSLGYPDLTDEEAREFYTTTRYEDYELNIIGRPWFVHGKHLPYKTQGKLDADDSGAQDEIAFINSTTAPNASFRYFYQDKHKQLDALGGLTYLMTDDVNKVAVFGFDSTLSTRLRPESSDPGHLTGQKTEGEYTKDNIDWYKELVPQLVEQGYTNIGLGHHNVVPHFTVQEKYLPAFVTYGWEEVAEAFASTGIQYFFTGHLHANDIENYVSYNNNTMYDIETGATISYGAAMRRTIIQDYGNGKQNLLSDTLPMVKADFSYLIESGNMPKGYEDCLDGNIVDVQKYIDKKLFAPYLNNMIDSFLSHEKIFAKIDSLKSMNAMGLTIDLKDLVYVLLNEVNTKVLKDYTYKGDSDSLKLEENKFIAYLHELLTDAIELNVADGKTFRDLVIFAYGAHLMGAEVDNENDLPAWVKDALYSFRYGDNMHKVVDKLLYDKENGIYQLVEKLATTPLDLSSCNDMNKKVLDTALLTLQYPNGADHIVLNDLVPLALNFSMLKDKLGGFTLKGDNLMDGVDNLLADFLTPRMERNIGGVLSDIAVSFAVDNTSYDGDFNENIISKVNANDAYSIMGYGNAKVTPTASNGRLPSNITVTMGTDPTSTRNFVWLTSQFLPNGSLQYKEDGGSWVTVDSTSELLAYSYAMADFGIYSSKIDKNITRHNVRLTNLKPDTKYIFKVGDASRNVWSTEGSFKTAPNEKKAFDVTILSDLQGMSSAFYDDLAVKFNKAKALTDNSAFTINMGDIVSDGKNSSQWDYALNKLDNYWLNTTTIVVAGNRDNKPYECKPLDPKKRKVDNKELTPISYLPLAFHYDMNGTVTDSKMYYSFDYSGVHFVVVDTNDLVDADAVKNLDSTQLDWLKTDLATNKAKPTIVLMHKGMFSNGMHANDPDTLGLRAQLAPVFYENKVDLVISGHDNVYSETDKLDGTGNKADDGVKYINIAGIKSNSYNVDNTSVATSAPKVASTPGYTFGKLSFDGTKVSYQGYAYNNGEFVTVDKYSNESPEIKPNPNPENNQNIIPDKADKKKNNVGLYVTLGVIGGIIVIGAIVGVVIYMKKKKA